MAVTYIVSERGPIQSCLFGRGCLCVAIADSALLRLQCSQPKGAFQPSCFCNPSLHRQTGSLASAQPSERIARASEANSTLHSPGIHIWVKTTDLMQKGRCFCTLLLSTVSFQPFTSFVSQQWVSLVTWLRISGRGLLAFLSYSNPTEDNMSGLLLTAELQFILRFLLGDGFLPPPQLYFPPLPHNLLIERL